MLPTDANTLNDHHLARALRQASNPIFIVDKAGVVVWCNQAYAEQIGRPSDDVLGKCAPSLTPSADKAKFFLALWQTVAAGKTWIGELVEKRMDGSVVNVDAVFTPLADARGRPTLFLVTQHDITNKKIEYEKLAFRANHDRVTGLHNRAYFSSMLLRTLGQADRGNKQAALLFIDLDGFKGVNDTLGHEAGDQVLAETAKVLENFVRRTDLVARFGGDEFVCLLSEIESVDAALMVAQKIVDAIGSISNVERGSVNVGASVGVAMYPDHGTTEEEICKAADTAMYEAKRSGKRCVKLYTPTEEASVA